MKRMLWSFIAALGLLLPAMAFAADGFVTGNVSMRAGPDFEYPLIVTIPAGAPVSVQGCTAGWEWCDVIGQGTRGWIAGNYIQYTYNGQPVLIGEYGAQIGIPIVGFAIASYWGRYYLNRPFYRDRARWYSRPFPHRPPPRPIHRPGRPGGGGHRPPGGNRPNPGNGHRPPPRPNPGNGNRPPPRPNPGNGQRPPPRPNPGNGNRPQPATGGQSAQPARR